MQVEPGDVPCNARSEIDEEITGLAEEELREEPHLEQDVHVDGDMEEAEVEEAGGDETPPLSRLGEGREVSAPGNHLLRGEVRPGDQHQAIDGDIDGDEGDGDEEGLCWGGCGWLGGLLKMQLGRVFL